MAKLRALTASYVAGVGTTMRRTCVPVIATTTILVIVTTMWGSAS